jgi:HPt (histidine-containing phosphotransfer) domain-containing protein
MTEYEYPDQACDSEFLLDTAAIERIRDMEVAGQPSILEEVVSLYLELAPELMESARRGLVENTPRSVFSAAHQLKSMSAQLGALQVAETALLVEQRGRQGEISGLQPLLDELDRRVSLSCKALIALR